MKGDLGHITGLGLRRSRGRMESEGHCFEKL